MSRLSLLVPTLECRRGFLARLLERLRPQFDAGVEFLTECDNGEAAIGAKRNCLLDRAAGDYVAFIDDDDLVSDDYVASLLEALAASPDAVGFRSVRYQDGRVLGECTYSTAVRDGDDEPVPHTAREKWVFRRGITHLTPVRRELALATRFEPWCFGEDRDYSFRLRPLIKTAAFDDKVLYHYYCRSRDARENEKTHPDRWCDGNARLTRSCG